MLDVRPPFQREWRAFFCSACLSTLWFSPIFLTKLQTNTPSIPHPSFPVPPPCIERPPVSDNNPAGGKRLTVVGHWGGLEKRGNSAPGMQGLLRAKARGSVMHADPRLLPSAGDWVPKRCTYMVVAAPVPPGLAPVQKETLSPSSPLGPHDQSDWCLAADVVWFSLSADQSCWHVVFGCPKSGPGNRCPLWGLFHCTKWSNGQTDGWAVGRRRRSRSSPRGLRERRRTTGTCPSWDRCWATSWAGGG